MSEPVQKVVPVVTRQHNCRTELLLFVHPTEKIQLVKGTLEPGEELSVAALRELEEESGITDAVVREKMGEAFYTFKGEAQHWHFFRVELQITPPDQWDFFANEDGGLWFKLFWQDIDQPLDTDWPEVFDAARLFIRAYWQKGTTSLE